MNPTMFREYDIRGIAGKDMTETDVYDIGRGIGSFLRQNDCRKIVVGQDCRRTSPQYASQIVAGLRAAGCDVTRIGICPTPVLYFAIHHLRQEGAVMVTASHNPPEYNGFKLCKGSDSIYGRDIQKILRIIDQQDFIEGSGTLAEADVIHDYINFVVHNVTVKKTMRLALDAGNGTAGVVAVPVLEALGCEVHPLYCDMDGDFPNHEADPTVAANLAELIALVREQKLDLGIGYDGDGDRIGVVDETGQIIWGDRLMIIFAREILSRKPGATFISEVKCSQTMYDDIEKHGGRAIMWKTGHSLIKQKMKEEKAELAGEMSGHLFFADRYFGYDDAIYASCRLIEILAETGSTLSELLADVPETFSTPEIRVECPDDIKFRIVDQMTAYFRQHHPVIDIDGARILFDDGWGLIRASNTQPALVLRFEALSPERRDAIRSVVEDKLAEMRGS